MSHTIGFGVIIVKNNKFLVGIRGRECKQGRGLWALPGGMVEPNESIESAIKREVAEECGLDISLDSKHFETPVFAVTDHFPLQHLSFWTIANWRFGDPVVKEPHKCERWEWKTLSEVSQIPGVHNQDSEAYYWLPMPLLKRHLMPILVNKK